MDRLDLELYADRLARHAERLTDDLSAARLRLAWADLERRARARLRGPQAACLEAAGVLGAATGDDDRALTDRRLAQLEALGALQAFVEEELRRVRRRPP